MRVGIFFLKEYDVFFLYPKVVAIRIIETKLNPILSQVEVFPVF